MSKYSGIMGLENMNQDTPCACDLSAHTPPERIKHRQLMREVLETVLERHERPLGYEFIFQATRERFEHLSQWVWLEQRCCPFLRFSLHLEPATQQIKLEVLGTKETKPMILANFAAAQ
jgi:hypothetical protein